MQESETPNPDNAESGASEEPAEQPTSEPSESAEPAGAESGESAESGEEPAEG